MANHLIQTYNIHNAKDSADKKDKPKLKPYSPVSTVSSTKASDNGLRGKEALTDWFNKYMKSNTQITLIGNERARLNTAVVSGGQIHAIS